MCARMHAGFCQVALAAAESSRLEREVQAERRATVRREQLALDAEQVRVVE